MSLDAFRHETGRIADILCTVNLLSWDARVMMPPAGVDARGSQIATLTSLARDLAVSESFERMIQQARQDQHASSLDTRALDEAERAVAVLKRIPPALLSEAATLKTTGQAVWAKARSNDDFPSFAPVLERSMAIQREMAEAIGYESHPYDAMVGLYEPGATWARLEALYAELKAGLLPLIEAAPKDEPPPEFLTRRFALEGQKRFAQSLAARLGYDFTRGRLDETVHPFEISIDRTDVRITSRYREGFLPGGFFGALHEAGHGLYEQGIAADLSRTIFAVDLVNLYAVGGSSFAVHESQSRLLENRVGRSERFWHLHFGELRDIFPDELKGVNPDSFWRAVNGVRPSLIRVEADELTYDLHIILRSEIEAGLMDGTIPVADLPGIWRDKVRSYLGLDVPSDTLGVLQDVHWSSGLVGSFPTYTLGNIMSSQFFAAARGDATVEAGLELGDYDPLRLWLNHNVHRFGRSRQSNEILMEATGGSLDLRPYLFDLKQKVERLNATTP